MAAPGNLSGKYFKSIDRGMAKIRLEIEKIDGMYVTVGVHAAKAQRRKTDVTNILVASVQEFGTTDGHVPARSFLRSTIESRAADLKRVRERVLAELASGKITARQAGGILAQWAEGAVKRTISTLEDPPLAQSTIDRKGSTKPLIDTGQMRNSIRGVVHQGSYQAALKGGG